MEERKLFFLKTLLITFVHSKAMMVLHRNNIKEDWESFAVAGKFYNSHVHFPNVLLSSKLTSWNFKRARFFSKLRNSSSKISRSPRFHGHSSFIGFYLSKMLRLLLFRSMCCFFFLQITAAKRVA